MPNLTNHWGAAPLAPGNTINVAMDGHAVSTDGSRIGTSGVADCLVMILHDVTRTVGGLAHISYPHSIGQRAGGHPLSSEQLHGPDHSLRILNHVARIRDWLMDRMTAEPQNVDVLLWRGFGFGYSLPSSRPDIQNNLNWGHFRRVIDFLGHFAPEDVAALKPSLPHAQSQSCVYDPNTGFVWFP